jgi:hypothetical protein
MNLRRTISFLLAAGVLSVTSSVRSQIVLLEQNVNFQLKVTTLKPPVVDKTIASFSAKMSTYSVTVTTRDLVKTLGFSPSAKIIARLVIMTNVSPAQVLAKVVVKEGSAETDVTSTLGGLVSTNNPLSVIERGVFASGVIKGTAQASLLQNSVSASLQAQTYEQIGVKLSDLQAGGVTVGGLEVNAAGLTTSTIGLKGSMAAVDLRVSTKTQLSGGAFIINPPLFTSMGSVPAVIQGTITTQGSSHIETASLPDFIDISDITGS